VHLEKEKVHDKLLELMENCQNERDAMWMKSRMELRLWPHVQATTSWTDEVDPKIIRTLALAIAQAAFEHLDNPKLNSRPVP
jgi:hypothetical protein